MKTTILPLCVQKRITSILSLAFPACLVLSNERMKSHYLASYINCYGFINQREDLDYSIYDVIDYARPNVADNAILDFSFLGYEEMKQILGKQSFVEYCINRIQTKTYIISFLDEFYLENRKETNKSHFVHEFLIYGFDNEKRVFLAIAFNNENVFTSMELSYDNVERGAENCLNYYRMRGIAWLHDRLIIEMKEKDNLLPLNDVTLCDTILHKVSMYRRSVPVPIVTADTIQSAYYGITAFRAISQAIEFVLRDEKNADDFLNIVGGYKMLHAYAEHKWCVFERMSYLEEHGCISSNKYHQVAVNATIIRMMCLKARTLKTRDEKLQLLDKMRMMLNRNYSLEFSILEKVLP